MKPEEATWRHAIEDEEAASAAVVAAERNLQQLVQQHLASSPTVDDAVSELALRRSEYSLALGTTDEAAAAYHRAEWEVIVAERDRRRADHQQRSQAVMAQAPAGRHQAVATRASGATHSHPSSSENDSPPRPTKRLNLGRPSSAPLAPSTGREKSDVRSGDSEDGSSSGGAGGDAGGSEEGGSVGGAGDSEDGSSSGNAGGSEDGSSSGGAGGDGGGSKEGGNVGDAGDSEDGSSSGNAGGSEDGSSSGNAGDSEEGGSVGGAGVLRINMLMPMHLYDPQLHGVPPRAPAPALVEAGRTDYSSDSESESQRADSEGNEGNEEESLSTEVSEFVPSNESEDYGDVS